MRGRRGGKAARARRGWDPRARHPEFRPTGDQRSDALQLLAIEAAKRRQAAARAVMVYTWSAGAGGTCAECGTVALQLYSGIPPLDGDLPHARGVCRPCAAAYEENGREERSAT